MAAVGRRFAWRRWLPLLVLALGSMAFFTAGLQEQFSLERIRQERETLLALVDRWPLLSVLAFAGIYMLMVALSVPIASLLSLLAGFLFGPLLGTLVAVIAATTGATLVFLAARTALGAGWRQRRAGIVHRLRAGFAANAFSYLLVLRLIPQVPFFAVNLAAAFLGVPLATYVCATLLGIVPAAAVIVGLGSSLGAVLDAGGAPDLAILWRLEVIGPLLGLAGLSLLPVLYKAWRGRQAQRQAER